MAEKSLRTKTISGVIWSAVQKFGTLGISFISNMVLARLLSPDDYGCIGMLAIFIAVSMTFIDGGFGSALIQKKSPTQEDYSTIFWWNLFISIVLYILLYISSPYIASFYNMEILSDVLRVQGIILILNALNVIQTNQLRKKLELRALAVVNLISSILSVIITIYMAWKGFGIWSLVAHQLLYSGFNAVLLWIKTGWLPSFTFSLDSFKSLFGFGGFILLSNIINTFCNNLQGLLIGKFFTPAITGYYTQARKLEELASNTISSVIDQVSYPVLAEFQNDHIGLVKSLRKFIVILAYLTFPLMSILILCAEPLITLVYSDKWLQSVPYFQVLCLAGFAICLQSINYNAIAAIGRSGKLFKWTLIKRGLGLIVLVSGLLLFDMDGLLAGVVLTSWIIYLINAYLVSKYLPYTLFEQFKDLLPVILISVISFIPSYFLPSFISQHIYILAIIQLFVFVIIYIVMSVIFRIAPYKDIKTLLFNKNR